MKNKLLIIVLIMFCIMFTTPVYAYNYWRCDGIKLIKTGNTELENPTNKPNIDECGIIVKPGETFKDANKCYEEKNQGSYFVYEATTEPTYKVSKDQISETNYSCHAQSRGSCTGLSIKEECELFSESCKWEADSCKTKPTTTKVTTTGGAIVPVTFSSGNMSEMLDVCESSGTLQVIYVAKIVFAFICYAVPILITITLTIDISKVVTDPTQVKKVVDVAKKRILIGLLLLFTPTLVKLLINSLGSDSDLQRCYNNAKPSHIKARKEYEREYFSTHSTHTVRESTTRTVVGVPLSLSKSDEWVVNNNRSEGLFGYYLYVPKNPKTNMPLVIIFPGDNRFCDTCGETNSSSDLMYSYFINNYGSGKKYNYSDAFILIPKIDYTPYENITTIINNFVNSTPLVDNKTINNLQIDKSRMSIVGFSTGASVIFSYATKYKSSVSAMLVVSSGANVGAVTGDLNFYKQLPMKGTAEGQGDQTYASSTRAIFETLGKKSQFTLANDYKHRDMHIFVFSRDENGDRFNDYIEWLISQQRGGGSTTPIDKVDKSNKCVNPFIQYRIGEPASGTLKKAEVRTDNLAVPLYSSYNNGTVRTVEVFHEDIKEQAWNILNNISLYVKENSDIISKFQSAGAYSTKGYNPPVPMSYSYHTQGFAIDLFNEWCYTKNGTTYCPYNSQGEYVWSQYKKFICEVCNGKEDCRYNINYQIYKYYFEGNNWCWGGNWGPADFDPMHFEVVGKGLQCSTSYKQEVTC